MPGPEKTFRIGRVSASVFKNEVDKSEEGGKRTLRNVNLQRRFKDGDGEWKNTASFGLADLPNAIRVLELALHYVETKEAAST